MHILVSVVLFFLSLFFFFFFLVSGFTPCVAIVNKLLAMQTIGQIVGIRLTT